MGPISGKNERGFRRQPDDGPLPFRVTFPVIGPFATKSVHPKNALFSQGAAAMLSAMAQPAIQPVVHAA